MNRPAIICVDDEEIILSSLGNQLKRSFGNDYDIELAYTPEEALDLCAELKESGTAIPLVISDQIMPGMSGDEFCVILHAYYPKTLKILLTGQAEANDVGNIVNAAALYRYIAKPWDETDLILTVKEALRRYDQEQELAEQNALLKQANITLKQTNQLIEKGNQKVAKSLKLPLAVFETAGDGILVLDNHDEVIIFNQKFANLWQINPDYIKGDSKHILGLISRRLTEPTALNLILTKSQPNSLENNLLKLNNGIILESYFQTQKLDRKIVGKVWGFRDVTVKEKEKAIAKHKSQHDTLTELPKRSILTYQISDAITKAQRDSHLLAVMFVDLNRFKNISNTLGHQIGDRLLQKVVSRLKECIRGEDVIARWGNDEFTLLLPKIHSRDEATAIASRILKAFKSSFSIENRSVHVTISIGIAVHPEHGADAETLLKNADAALSQSQQFNLHNYQYYDPAFSSQAHKSLTLNNLLHSALARNEFSLDYQPIVNLLTGKIAKMEALLRWKNPQLGSVSPSVFIPLAEENGSIISIGEWVLKTACLQTRAWQAMGLSPLKISVNLSMCQFQQSNLISTIVNTLEQAQLPSEYLEIEITESVTMQNTEFAKTILNRLNNIGITLSMDDFGTGYSSLGYLKQFPFHTIKIDRSFITNLHTDSIDLAIVNAIVALGQGLKLDVVAEGVETEKTRDLLKKLGCGYIQGYLFSKPLPASEATKLLEKHSLISS